MHPARHPMIYSAWLGYVRRNKGQLVRFTVVGLLTFVLYFSLFHLLYGEAGLGYKVAVSIAYSVTVLCHFLLHRLFTFGAQRLSLSRHAGRYGVMLVLNYGITLGVMWTVVEIVRISPYFGTIASTICTAASSFFVMKHFVFSPSEASG